MSKEQCITPRGDERCFDLKPDAKGFAYVLMWMDHLLEHDQDADPSYVLEWRVFVEACRSAMLSETVARQDIPEGRGSLPAGALERGSPLDAARGVNPGGAAPGGVSERCDDKKDDAWRSAALRLGEQLAPTGPNWYYAMTPTQWLEWCQSALPSAELSMKPVAYLFGPGQPLLPDGLTEEQKKCAQPLYFASRSATAFIPTHKHADGGLYRFVQASKYKTAADEQWSDAVIYEASDGKLYVTTPARWNDRFVPMNATDRTTPEKP